MRAHFWIVLALTAGLFGLCGCLLDAFPERQTGTSVAHQSQQLYLWAGAVCGAGAYAALLACVLTHAWAGRWRFRATVVGSALYLWVCGGGLFALIADADRAATPEQVVRLGFFLFIESVAAVMYAAALLVIHAGAGLQRPTRVAADCPTCGRSFGAPGASAEPPREQSRGASSGGPPET